MDAGGVNKDNMRRRAFSLPRRDLDNAKDTGAGV